MAPTRNDDQIRSGNRSRRHLPAAEPNLQNKLAGRTATDRLFELLAHCALKDEKAFAALYRISSPKLFAVAIRITRRRDWAEEVLQESFVNIWHHAGSYDGERSAPMTWMTARQCTMTLRNYAPRWRARNHARHALPGASRPQTSARGVVTVMSKP